MKPLTETEKLAGYVAGLRYEDLPGDVIALAKSCFLDTLGCALAGSLEKDTRRLAHEAAACHGGEDATAWAISQRTSVAGAAMANAICAESADFTYALGGTTILPVAIAVAEKERLSGRELLVAIIAGHEVMWRIHKSVNQFALQQRGFYPQGVCAIFGPSAAAAKLLGLDAAGIANAICLAAGAGIGIRAYSAEGHRTKQFYLGTAAASGVTIGYLARGGMQAARLSLEGERTGFFPVYAGTQYDSTGLSYQLGEAFMMRRTAFKLYPACRYVHTSVDAARELASKVQAENVECIEVRVPSMAAQVAGDRAIRSAYDCQFSIPWAVAVTLVDGQGLSVDQVSAGRVNDSEVRALADKVKVCPDPELDRGLEVDGLPPVVIACRMKVMGKNGSTVSAAVDYARGSAENPPTQNELRAKFEHLVERVVSCEQVREIESLVEGLEDLPNLSPLITAVTKRI